MSPAIRTQKARRPNWDRLFIICAVLIAAVAVTAILLLYTIEPPPDNARVVADEQRQTYASTPCVVFNQLDRELIANRREITDPSKPLQLLSFANERTMRDIRSDPKWTRDKACNYATGFDQIVTVWMHLVGHRSRWSDDGQWRW